MKMFECSSIVHDFELKPDFLKGILGIPAAFLTNPLGVPPVATGPGPQRTFSLHRSARLLLPAASAQALQRGRGLGEPTDRTATQLQQAWHGDTPKAMGKDVLLYLIYDNLCDLCVLRCF